MDVGSLHQMPGLLVVCVVTDQTVGDRRSPGVTILGVETVYLPRQPSLLARVQVANVAMNRGRCTRWLVLNFLTGSTLRRHFLRAVAAAVSFVHVVAATSAWCCGTGKLLQVAVFSFLSLPFRRGSQSHSSPVSASRMLVISNTSVVQVLSALDCLQ